MSRSSNPVGRPVDPSSGLSRARVVLNAAPTGTTRKEAIASFVAAGLKKGTASAYYTILTRKPE